MIEWKEEYSTGFVSLDAQHRILFRYVNELEKMIQGEEPKTEARFSNTLDFLESYCRQHFAHEEQCMAERKCPVAAQNKMAHEKFIEYFNVIKDRFKKEKLTDKIMIDVHKATQDWLVHHICRIDVALKKTFVN